MEHKFPKAKSVDAADAEAWMVLAMAQGQLKRPEEARHALAKGVKLIEKKSPRSESGEDWQDWIIPHALMKEAKQVIES